MESRESKFKHLKNTKTSPNKIDMLLDFDHIIYYTKKSCEPKYCKFLVLERIR